MRTYRGGWTLVEVLVVLAIILVLAGLVYAVGAYALERSRQTQCISNLRQIGIALLQYMEDYKQADWEAEISNYAGIESQQQREQLAARWGFPPSLMSLRASGYVQEKRLFLCS